MDVLTVLGLIVAVGLVVGDGGSNIGIFLTVGIVVYAIYNWAVRPMMSDDEPSEEEESSE